MHSQFDTVDNDNKAHNNSPDHRVTVTLSRGAKRDIPAICFSCGAETMYRGNAKAWADYQAGYRNSESVFRNLADRDKHWLLSGLCYDCQPA